MKLTDLEPRWINPERSVFIFRCPARPNDAWLSCKRVAMRIRDQMDMFREAVKDDAVKVVVPMEPDYCWAISGDDFSTMTVSPSIDASKAGHWHGHITNGEIK